MYAAKFLAIAAAVFAVADVEARKHKKKHNKKSAVTRGCKAAKEATFLIDGISTSSSKKLLKDIPNDVSVTFLFNQDEIRSRRNNKFIRKLSDKKEHNLAFRFRPSYDAKFQKTKPKRIVDTVKRAKTLFKKNYNHELKYVFFPWSKHHLTKHVKAVEAAGFTVFGNNLDLPKHFRRHSKKKVENDIKKLSKNKKAGSIVYQTVHNTKIGSNLSWVEHKLENRGFKIVSLDECLAEESSSEEELPIENPPAPTGDATMAAAQQAATEPDTDAASSLTISAVAGAAVAFLMLVL